jgi:phosphoglycolate phosphatase
MGYDALIFDLDGTLWDAAAASTYGWNLALEKLGLSVRVTVDGIRSVSGKPFRQCVATLVPELGLAGTAPADGNAYEEALELLDDYERLGIETLGGILYEGVAEGLRELAKGLRLFIVSNCPDWYLEAFLRTSGLGTCFAGGDCHGASGLDKPGMLRALSEKYDVDRPAYVGDTQGDRDAAEAVGMDFVFVSYGFGETGEPSMSFASFGDLTARFLGEA